MIRIYLPISRLVGRQLLGSESVSDSYQHRLMGNSEIAVGSPSLFRSTGKKNSNVCLQIQIFQNKKENTLPIHKKSKHLKTGS